MMTFAKFNRWIGSVGVCKVEWEGVVPKIREQATSQARKSWGAERFVCLRLSRGALLCSYRIPVCSRSMPHN